MKNFDSNMDSGPVLIVGLPRSGTTWIGEVFSSDPRIRYIFEPDNEKLSPLAWLCKNESYRFPYLTSRDVAPLYGRLWYTIFFGRDSTWFANMVLGVLLKRNSAAVESFIGNKGGLVYVDETMYRVGVKGKQPYSPESHPLMTFFTKLLVDKRDQTHPGKRRVVIKSVHASLCAEWIASHFPVKIVFVLRNPFSLYASYKRLNMPDGFRNLLFQETLQRDKTQYMSNLKPMFMGEKEDQIAFQIMLMYKIVEKQISMHPEWMVISHDRLCLTPNESYRMIFTNLGLNWSKSTISKIHSLNKSGVGFTPKRISSQQPSKWKLEINSPEKAVIQKWIDRFELQRFFQTHVNPD